ncbi:MAG: ComF family protein [Proteobacteria bacterium]|nr:ComF family protein [Pseudomonadota bacterium]
MPDAPTIELPKSPGLTARAVRAIADIIVPPVCLACHVRLDSPDALCARCWSRIEFIRPPLCDRLGLPLPFGAAEGPMLSAAAIADPPLWNRARAVAAYDGEGPIAGLIHAMKYADRHDARRLFGRWLADAGRDLLADAHLIVPVPLTRRRLLKRRFNQSALLARELSAVSGKPWHPFALAKLRETVPQASLSGQARRDNLRGAFAVPDRRRALVAGRNVIVLDDVITTGATVETATKALLAAGAARVDVLALALVTRPSPVLP